MQFQAPGPAERLAALGSIDQAPEALQRSLDTRNFEPIPSPGPGDWLAHQPESGQTFEDFVSSRPKRPDERRRKLYVQPIGSFSEPEAPSLEELTRFARAFFALETEVTPPVELKLEHVHSRRNPAAGQAQLLTMDLLDLLREELRDDAFALIGVTMVDLYPDPRWNFAFGQAALHERVGVYSFARYDPRFYGEELTRNGRTLILRRSCNVLAHEACHLFGIEHCIWYRCLMNGSNHLAESDARPLHLCPVDLRKLQWSIGFDVVERYRHLLEFATRAGFSEEAVWLERELRSIEGE